MQHSIANWSVHK